MLNIKDLVHINIWKNTVTLHEVGAKLTRKSTISFTIIA